MRPVVVPRPLWVLGLALVLPFLTFLTLMPLSPASAQAEPAGRAAFPVLQGRTLAGQPFSLEALGWRGQPFELVTVSLDRRRQGRGRLRAAGAHDGFRQGAAADVLARRHQLPLQPAPAYPFARHLPAGQGRPCGGAMRRSRSARSLGPHCRSVVNKPPNRCKNRSHRLTNPPPARKEVC